MFWNLARLPQESQLDIEKTFESQKDLVVKMIVPNLMKTLDLNTYPIGECVVYEMIHQRHRHQREILRNKEKPQDERKRVARQKHLNSRRLEVNICYILLVTGNRYLFTSFINRKRERDQRQ